MIEQLYTHYGSRLTTGTSELLYDALMQDEALAPFFASVDMAVLRSHMADFIGSVTGGPHIYEGRSMAEAHQGFQITPYHFQRVAMHLHDALIGAGIAAQDADNILAEIGKLRALIVNTDQ